MRGSVTLSSVGAHAPARPKKVERGALNRRIALWVSRMMLLIAALRTSDASLMGQVAGPPASNDIMEDRRVGEDAPPLTLNLATLEVIVIVIGPGEALVSKFGHSALWLRDEGSGLSLAFNYGLSATNERSFLRRLASGQVIARRRLREAGEMLQEYPTEDRSVELLELDLSEVQKRRLVEYLQSESFDEASLYAHDFYLANCTTPIRDAIDFALDGRLKDATGKVRSAQTYRSLSLPYLSGDPPRYVGVSGILGRAADRPITAWEEMFLPSTLRDRLLKATRTRDDGVVVPLVRAREWWYRAEQQMANSVVDHIWVQALIASALFLLPLLALSAPGTGARSEVTARAVATLWLIANGALGTTMWALWALTEQQWAYANENVLQSTPFHLVAAYLLWGSHRELRAARWLIALLALSAAIGVALKVTPLLYQTNAAVLALTVPGHIGLTWVLWRTGRCGNAG